MEVNVINYAINSKKSLVISLGKTLVFLQCFMKKIRGRATASLKVPKKVKINIMHAENMI